MTDTTSPPATPSLTSLQGRVALITGGSRGLGAAIAQVLGESGMHVAIADIELQRAQDCAAVLGERDIEAIALPLDVSDPAQCQRAIGTVVNEFGRMAFVVLPGIEAVLDELQ